MRTFWARWLAVASGIVLVFGLLLVVAAEPMRQVFQEIYYVSKTGWRLGEAAASYTLFVQGILGATMRGWGVLMLFVALKPFKDGEPYAWNMFAASLGVWYVVDTAFSIWAGYPQNAVLNTVLAALFLIPLIATFRHFRLRAQRAAEAAEAAAAEA